MASAAAGFLKTQPHLRWDGRRPPDVVRSLHEKEQCIISLIRAETSSLPCCHGRVVATNNTSREAEYLLLSAGCSTGSAETLRWDQPLVCASWEAAPDPHPSCSHLLLGTGGSPWDSTSTRVSSHHIPPSCTSLGGVGCRHPATKSAKDATWLCKAARTLWSPLHGIRCTERFVLRVGEKRETKEKCQKKG